jgi:glycosyltransferase involved in cell wall biosynthesis
MRLLLLAQFFPPDIGGEERHVFNLANTLADRGHEVAVATQSVEGLPEKEVLATGVRVYRFSTMAMHLPGVYSSNRQHHPPFPDLLGMRNLSRILQWERPEVVHAHNWIVNSILPLHRKGTGHPEFGLVLTLHDYSRVCATKRLMRHGSACEGPAVVRCMKCTVSHYGPVVGPVTATATAAMRLWKDRAVDYMISVSRAVANGNGIPDSPAASVIPNFVLDSTLMPMSEGSDEATTDHVQRALPAEPFLLFVGDLSREKGVHTLLRAYDSLGIHRPPLVLIGRRTPDTPKQLPNGAEIYVEWPHEWIMTAFRLCLVAVLPSVWADPCPTTVLEAMACGCPVITTAIGGMVDMILDEKSGLLVHPGDERELAAALKRLLTDDGLRTLIGIGARERVRIFTSSGVVEQLEAVYEQVAPRPSAAPDYRSPASCKTTTCRQQRQETCGDYDRR